ncbi:MAG: indole-3-glycerol phosphate synthase TrpC [Bacteroidales bacterium]|nr:indole-3-glycerol phosphate synthase TrpC [Bacteroidales bacterium]
MTILEKILINKKKELLLLKNQITITDLERSRFFFKETKSLKEFISDPSKTGIIAEFKRASPSKGTINPDASVMDVTQGYSRGGASGLSILTDRLFFGGSSDDLVTAREYNSIPVLRKDFIIDEFQIPESKAIGADAILLLASVLTGKRIRKFTKMSHSLGMEVICEIHSLSEIEMVNEDIDIIGVNNRDLKSFDIDINVSLGLADRIPEKFIKISESGISSSESVIRLRQAGYNGFLIGELFMKSPDPVMAFMEFTNKIRVHHDKSKSLRLDRKV